MDFLTTTELTEHTERDLDPLTGKIIGPAIDIHRALGPGLLESAYEACFIYELRLRKLRVEHQKALPVFYKVIRLIAKSKRRNSDNYWDCDLAFLDDVIIEVFHDQLDNNKLLHSLAVH